MRRTLLVLFAVGAIGALAVLYRGRRRIAHLTERVLERTGAATVIASAFAKPAPPLGPRGTLDVHARPVGPHPRILLSPERLAKVVAQKDASTPQWKWLSGVCDGVKAGLDHAGYEGWDWANDTLALAMCWRVTHNPTYGDAGVHYLVAILDDREQVGDAAGGDPMVRHDSGYGIRARGALGAIAYDWLFDAPAMTPAVRKKFVDRMTVWTTWFKANGFHHEEPISNYYAGYFGAVAFAGIAAEGEDPRVDAMRMETQRMWNDEIVPAYTGKLPGGDFPEGWQYGDNTGWVFATYADAETLAHPAKPGGPPPKSLFDELHWLRESVKLKAFELLPDGVHTYANADWSHLPAVAPAHYLYALAVCLPANDPAARQAQFLVRLAREQREEWRWMQILGDDPSRPVEDPRRGQASFFSPGTATAFARSSFAPSALWVSFTSSKYMADHQHLDAGHFEVARGGDQLLIDGGGYGAWSSLSHNVLAVDDPLQSSDWETSKAHHDIINYKRNQAPFSDSSHMERFEDGGGYVYAVGDYASAFNPKGYPDERKERAVTRAERVLFFSRTPVANAGPGETGRVVVYDRMSLLDPRFTTAVILHNTRPPQVTFPTAKFTTGTSSAWVTTVLPPGSAPTVVDETHNGEGERPYFNNFPPEGATSFRYEVGSPVAGATTERRFLHTIVVGAATASPPVPEKIDGDHVDGAALDGEAYVFARQWLAARPQALTYSAPQSATRHFVVDLAPSASYAVTVAPDGGACKVTLGPGAGKTTSAQGVLVLDTSGCAAH